MLVYPYGEARADTNWTGAVDNDWFNAGNWSTGVPNIGENTNVDTETNAPVIDTTGAEANFFHVGYNGIGTLTVSDGGTVSSANASFIGRNLTSTGTATVTGTGSSWISDSYFIIGRYGTGTLTISDGGTVSSANTTTIANSSTSNGTATVTGTGSSWISDNYFYVGASGTGALTISDGGTVSSANTTYIATISGSVGTLNIGSAEGDAPVAAGVLDTPLVTFGDGTAKIVFNHTDGCGDGSACGGVTGSSPAYDFTADVSGNGSILAKYGFTIMSGDLSAFTGTTTVDDTASLSFSGAYGGDIAVEDNSSVEITGAVSGDISVSSGSTISVLAPVAGNAIIGTGSTLVANDTISGTVDVNDGGTLKGNGTVGNTIVASGAHVAPGNSIDTLNVTGDISFAPGSFYNVEVDASGNNDKVIATGTATITGGSVWVYPYNNMDDVKLDTPYTILTANTGVNGTFDDVTLQNASLFLTVDLSYDATNIYATISKIGGNSLADNGITYNQRQVGLGLDTAQPSNEALVAVLKSSTTAETQSALDRLSGELYANVKGDLLGREASFSELMLEHADDFGRTAATAATSANADEARVAYERTQTWATYYGDWSQRDSDTYNDVTASTQGFAFGRQGAVNDNTAVGIAASYGRTTYNQEAPTDNSAKAHIDHYRIGATAAHKQDNLTLKGSVHYGYHRMGTERRVTIPYYTATQTAETNAHSLSSAAELAYRFQPSINDSIEPYARIAYGYGHSDGFEEKGGDGSLRARQDAFTEGSTKIGARLQQKLAFGDTPANLNINLGWQHKLGSLTPEGRYSIGEGQTFRSQGAAHSRDALTFKAGLDLYLTDALMMDLSYQTDQSKSTATHNVNVGMKLAF